MAARSLKRLTDEQRRALQLLATSPHGPTEEVLVLAHGFDSDMLAELVRAKLAKRYVLTVRAGGRMIGVTYMTILAAGRKAIEE